MKLSQILRGIKSEQIINFYDYNIECLTHNSADVIENSIFFCINGGHVDGGKYVNEALSKGAKVIVTEHKIQCECTVITVDNVRLVMSLMAKNFYNRSDEKLQKVAIIGTNGKTTTSFVIAKILRESGKNVGIIGTNGVYINETFLPNNLTTPDPIELHYIFSQMVSFGVDYVVMEVSAHAIYYNKIYGIKFDIGVFTNVSNEHLDFFGTMDNYIAVKKSVFNKKYMKMAVVNTDDNIGVDIAKSSNIPVVSYGIYNPANIFAVKISMNINKCTFVANANDEILNITTQLIGEYNVYNILASIGVAKLLKVDNKYIINAISNIKNVAGRFMQYDLGENKKIIIDFAHTPDGFEKVLSLIKKLRKGKITVLFGCVGYSDYAKRVEMGEIANKYADEIIITTDNLGYENFEKSCADISTKIKPSKIVGRIEDRKTAIEIAFDRMKPNDTLVCLGKGVENKQVVKGENIDYCDVDVVNNLLKENNK